MDAAYSKGTTNAFEHGLDQRVEDNRLSLILDKLALPVLSNGRPNRPLRPLAARAAVHNLLKYLNFRDLGERRIGRPVTVA
jgi:hypothetical protein